MNGVSNELRRLYRRTAKGESPIEVLGTLTNTLHILAKVMEMEESDAEVGAIREVLRKAGYFGG